MNVGKKLHLILAVAGLGAFLVASPARAQQETNPDHFTATGVVAFGEAGNAVPRHRARVILPGRSQRTARARVVAASRRASTRAVRRAPAQPAARRARIVAKKR